MSAKSRSQTTARRFAHGGPPWLVRRNLGHGPPGLAPRLLRRRAPATLDQRVLSFRGPAIRESGPSEGALMQADGSSGARRPAFAEPDLRREEMEERSEHAWAAVLTEALARVPPPRSAFGPPEPSPADSATPSPTATGESASSNAPSRPSGSAPTQRTLSTEVTVGHLGRVAVSVSKGADGLDIVINVADIHVKALITAEVSGLHESLRKAGLSVSTVRICAPAAPGTTLAGDRERPRTGMPLRLGNPRLRAYLATPTEPDEENDSDESIHLTV